MSKLKLGSKDFFQVVENVFPGNWFQRRKLLDDFQAIHNLKLTKSHQKEIHQRLKTLKRTSSRFIFKYAVPDIVESATTVDELSRLLMGLKPFFEQFAKRADFTNDGKNKIEEHIERVLDDDTTEWMEIETEIQWEAIHWAELIRKMEQVVGESDHFDIEFSPHKTYTRIESSPGNLNDYNDPLYWTSSHSEGESSQYINVVPAISIDHCP